MAEMDEELAQQWYERKSSLMVAVLAEADVEVRVVRPDGERA